MRKENAIKVIKFVGKLTANYRANVRRDGDVYTLSVEYYTNRFENRPCSGDIRNGLFDITTTIRFIETRKGGLKVIDAQIKGTTPIPENNWNGWHEVDIHPKHTWSDIKREHNSVFGGQAFNELCTTREWVAKDLADSADGFYIGGAYENLDPLNNDLISIKEAV